MDVILDYLDRRTIFDRIRGNLNSASFLPIRKNFLNDLIKKMEAFIKNNESVFNDDIFKEHQSEFIHISHILRHKDVATIPGAVAVSKLPNHEKLSTFLVDNYEPLRRLCVVENNNTVSIMDSHERFFKVKNELSDKTSFNVDNVLNSKFVSDGIDFFVSPEFYAGLITSLYGVLAAAGIATAVSVLALEGMVLAITSLVCTVIFCILIPMVMGAAITSFVEWVYDDYKESLEDEIRAISPDYHSTLTSAGYHAVEAVNKDGEDHSNEGVPLLKAMF